MDAHRSPLVPLVITALALTGCTPGTPEVAPAAPPTVIDTPAQVWKDGIMPSGPLEEDEWVQAVRRFEIGRALAWNTGDFTISQYTSGTSFPEDLSNAYGKQGNDPYVYLAPAPSVILSSELDPTITGEHNTHRVEACLLPMTEWILPKTPFKREDYKAEHDYTGTFSPVLRTYRVKKLQDGNYEISAGGGAACDATGAAIGFFDPAPTLPETPVTKPVRESLPRETVVPVE